MNNIIDLRNLKNPPAGGEEKIEEKNVKEEETYLTEEDILEGINSQNITHINPQKRQLLKFLLVGSGAFALGLLAKSLGFSGLFSKSEIKSGLESVPQKEADFKNWRVIEQKEQLVFIDKKTNEDILILDL